MPSFDVVSKASPHEVSNAYEQTKKEIAQRYDFKDTETSLERNEKGFFLNSNSEGRVQAALEVLQGKFVKRGVSLKFLKAGPVEAGLGASFKQQVDLVEGIEQEKAKHMVRHIKDAKLKVQASIQGDGVRISGKQRDDLQNAIQALKGQDFGVELQFENFRD